MLSLPAVALRILVLGDSISRGTISEGDGGWRYGLQERLRAAHIEHQFVGPLTSNRAHEAWFQPGHHGAAGYDARRLVTGGEVPGEPWRVPGIIESIQRYRPDVVLLSVGTNWPDIPGLRGLLTAVLGACLSCTVYVATLPPQVWPRARGQRLAVVAYNAALRELVATFPGRVCLAEVGSTLDAADLTSDGVHPNRTGLRKMAAAWFAALRSFGRLK